MIESLEHSELNPPKTAQLSVAQMQLQLNLLNHENKKLKQNHDRLLQQINSDSQKIMKLTTALLHSQEQINSLKLQRTELQNKNDTNQSRLEQIRSQYSNLYNALYVQNKHKRIFSYDDRLDEAYVELNARVDMIDRDSEGQMIVFLRGMLEKKNQDMIEMHRRFAELNQSFVESTYEYSQQIYQLKQKIVQYEQQREEQYQFGLSNYNNTDSLMYQPSDHDKDKDNVEGQNRFRQLFAVMKVEQLSKELQLYRKELECVQQERQSGKRQLIDLKKQNLVLKGELHLQRQSSLTRNQTKEDREENQQIYGQKDQRKPQNIQSIQGKHSMMEISFNNDNHLQKDGSRHNEKDDKGKLRNKCMFLMAQKKELENQLTNLKAENDSLNATSTIVFQKLKEIIIKYIPILQKEFRYFDFKTAELEFIDEKEQGLKKALTALNKKQAESEIETKRLRDEKLELEKEVMGLQKVIQEQRTKQQGLCEENNLMQVALEVYRLNLQQMQQKQQMRQIQQMRQMEQIKKRQQRKYVKQIQQMQYDEEGQNEMDMVIGDASGQVEGQMQFECLQEAQEEVIQQRQQSQERYDSNYNMDEQQEAHQNISSSKKQADQLKQIEASPIRMKDKNKDIDGQARQEKIYIRSRNEKMLQNTIDLLLNERIDLASKVKSYHLKLHEVTAELQLQRQSRQYNHYHVAQPPAVFTRNQTQTKDIKTLNESINKRDHQFEQQKQQKANSAGQVQNIYQVESQSTRIQLTALKKQLSTFYKTCRQQKELSIYQSQKRYEELQKLYWQKCEDSIRMTENQAALQEQLKRLKEHCRILKEQKDSDSPRGLQREQEGNVSVEREVAVSGESSMVSQSTMHNIVESLKRYEKEFNKFANIYELTVLSQQQSGPQSNNEYEDPNDKVEKEGQMQDINNKLQEQMRKNNRQLSGLMAEKEQQFEVDVNFYREKLKVCEENNRILNDRLQSLLQLQQKQKSMISQGQNELEEERINQGDAYGNEIKSLESMQTILQMLDFKNKQISTLQKTIQELMARLEQERAAKSTIGHRNSQESGVAQKQVEAVRGLLMEENMVAVMEAVLRVIQQQENEE